MFSKHREKGITSIKYRNERGEIVEEALDEPVSAWGALAAISARTLARQ